MVVICFCSLCALMGCKDASKQHKEGNIAITDSPTKSTDIRKDVNIDNLNEDNQDETVIDIKASPNDSRILSEKYDFEDDTHDLLPRGGTTLTLVNTNAKSGKASLEVSRRTDYWRGVRYELTEYPGKQFHVSAWVMFRKSTEDMLNFNITLQSVTDIGTDYYILSTVEAVKGEWVFIEADVDVPENVSQASVYFELDDYCNFFIDDFQISGFVIEEVEYTSVPSLKENFKDYFEIGLGVTNPTLSISNYDGFIDYHFNSITMENEFNPQFILNKCACQSAHAKNIEEPVIDFSKMKVGLDYAKEHDFHLRGHTLVWHKQTPRWFFTKDYTENGELATRELMLFRMESYIKQILEYTNENYPGVITAWDVVSEAINPGDKHEKGYRTNDNYWYQILGEDYVYYSFLFARKYADEKVLLFYNDYNTYDKPNEIIRMVEVLRKEKLIDGIGMECHLSLGYPSVERVLTTIESFSSLGLQVHITQLDVAIQTTEEIDEELLTKQGTYYYSLFQGFQRLKDEGRGNIMSVTFWGITDNRSFRSENAPVLFDKDFCPKPAFYGVIGRKM